jgi:hypothetical protein
MTPDERARFDEVVHRLNELSFALADIADTANQALQSARYNGGGGFRGGGGFPISPALTGAGGIPAGGSDDVVLQELSGGVLVNGATVNCNNAFSAAVGVGGAMVMVGQDFQGNYWVLSEDC